MLCVCVCVCVCVCILYSDGVEVFRGSVDRLVLNALIDKWIKINDDKDW